MALDVTMEKLLSEWLAVRNAILRSTDAEMRITYSRDPSFEGGEGATPPDINTARGVLIELLLSFDAPVIKEFTPEERKEVEKAIAGDTEEELTE